MSDSNHGLSLHHSATGSPLPVKSGVSYELVLTGSNEFPTVSDLTIPVKSINSSFFLGATSFMSLSVPATPTTIDDVEAREKGDLILSQFSVNQNGTSSLERIYQLPLKEYSFSRGARSESLVLTGRGTLPKNVAPKTITLGKIITKSKVNSPDIKFDFDIQPIELNNVQIGDIVGDGIDSGTLEKISLSITNTNPRSTLRIAV